MNTEEAAPSPSEEDTARCAAAGAVLLKLDKSVRTRRFYDPTHELVRRFESELWTALQAFFEKYGDLSLRVRPTTFELSEFAVETPGGDEFALAFFRQGIIAIRFQRDLAEAEFSQFVGICSMGLQSSIHDTEDLPTLLWRGNLAHIQYAAPVGYTEEDGSLRSDDDLFVDQETVSQVIGESLSINFEGLAPEVRKAYEARVIKLKGVDDELPQELLLERAGATDETLRDLIRRTFATLKAVVSSPGRGAELSAEDVGRLFLHFRRAFIEGNDLEGLTHVAETTQSLLDSPTTSAADKAALKATLEQRIDENQLTEMLVRAPGGTAGNLDKVTQLIRVFGGNDRGLVARLADLDASDSGRTALNNVLSEVAGNDPEFLIGHFRAHEGKRAVEALALLARIDIAQARMAVAVRLPAASDETQLALLEAIHAIPDLLDERMQAALVRLASKGGPLRGRVLDSFTAHPNVALREAVLEWLKSPDADEWDHHTSEAAFRVVLVAGDISPILPYFVQVLERKSLFGRKHLVELKLAVVAALSTTMEPEAVALLERHGGGKDKELAAACRTALERMAFDRARGARSLRPGDDT